MLKKGQSGIQHNSQKGVRVQKEKKESLDQCEEQERNTGKEES